MAYPLTLPVGSLLTLNGNAISEHNRAPITLSIQNIEKSERMANGLTRRFFITTKRSLSVSWQMLPGTSAMTVDGKYGARDIKSLYLSTSGELEVTINYNNSVTESFSAFVTDANFEVVKRNVRNTPSSSPQEFWNVSLTLEEI
ncbi:hypothetical protein EB001_09930 [bacterium]|nr:hypothetical protein [bacterium]